MFCIKSLPALAYEEFYFTYNCSSVFLHVEIYREQCGLGVRIGHRESLKYLLYYSSMAILCNYLLPVISEGAIAVGYIPPCTFSVLLKGTKLNCMQCCHPSNWKQAF